MKKIILNGLALIILLIPLTSISFSLYSNHNYNTWFEIWRCKTDMSDCKKILDGDLPEEWFTNGQYVTLPVSIDISDPLVGVSNPQEYDKISVWYKPNAGLVKPIQVVVNIKNCELNIAGPYEKDKVLSPGC